MQAIPRPANSTTKIPPTFAILNAAAPLSGFSYFQDEKNCRFYILWYLLIPHTGPHPSFFSTIFPSEGEAYRPLAVEE